MKSEWKKIKVSELGEIVTGKTPKTSIPENYGGAIPFLTPSDNMNSKYVITTLRTLSQLGLMEVRKKILPPDSICVSCIGSDLGKVTITTQPTVTNQQINSIIVNQKKFDTSFVYYAMKIIGKQLNFIGKTSTAVPIVNKAAFSDYEISCPPIAHQQKIAAVLSSLDDKIALNNRINDNLQQQAQSIYYQWMIDNVGKYKIEPLSEVAEINPDTYSAKEQWRYVNYLDTSSVTNGLISELQYIEPSNEKLPSRAKRKLLPNDIVFSTVRPNQRHFGIISNPMSNMLASTGFAVIRSKHPRICNELIYLCLTENKFIDKMQQIAEQSTSTFPSIKPSDLAICEIPCPAESVSTGLTKILQSLFALISANQSENRTLTAIRDTLLPKLMSGEIDVKNIGI